MAMKKQIVIVVLLLALMTQGLWAESSFQPEYQRKEQESAIGILCFILGLTIDAIVFGFMIKNKDTILLQVVAPELISMAACGGAAWGGGLGLLVNAKVNLSRLEYAMDHESDYTDAEIRSIIDREIFVGMSEDALLGAYGKPRKIETLSSESKKYVYPQRNVYIENGIVSDWN